MTNLQDLYNSRCIDGKPHFWRPVALKYTKPTVLCNDSMPSTALSYLQKVIGLGLLLEIPVGRFISEARNKPLPRADDVLIPLLSSNAADETRHAQGFKYAANVYSYTQTSTYGELLRQWQRIEPILAACTLELGVFLVTLGFMRMFGGTSLSMLAYRISEDEWRHVATNVAVCKALDFRWQQHERLVLDTLEQVFGGFEHKVFDISIDFDWIAKQSQSLMHNLEAPELDSITRAAIHQLPFENHNNTLYGREYGNAV